MSWEEKPQCAQIATAKIAEAGLESLPDFAGNSTLSIQGDAFSDALSDVRLLKLIEVWPALADDVMGEMLTLAGLRPDDVDDVGAEVTLIGDGGRYETGGS